MYFSSTRQLTKHDASDIDPTKGNHCNIIAIDEFGVEHHSAFSVIPHSQWLWSVIVWWRYDDATMLEMQTFKIAELEDRLKETAR